MIDFVLFPSTFTILLPLLLLLFVEAIDFPLEVITFKFSILLVLLSLCKHFRIFRDNKSEPKKTTLGLKLVVVELLFSLVSVR